MDNTVKVKIVFVVYWLVTSQLSIAGATIEVAAQPENGFEFPFLLQIPDEIPTQDTSYLVVESNNTGSVSDDFSAQYQNTKEAINGNGIGPLVARELKYPILMPAFPRPESQWQIYTHALDRDTMLIETGKLQRLDLQLLAMIKAAKKVLSTHSINVESKIVMTGFSASGTFANRFSLLHPEHIKVVVAGGLNSILMLPIEKKADIALDYPLGVNDFLSVSGKPFDSATWIDVPQLLFMGEEDRNDAVAFDDGYSVQERQAVHKVLGKIMQPDRWKACQTIYQQARVNVMFKTYTGVGHGTTATIHNDIFNFIRANL